MSTEDWKSVVSSLVSDLLQLLNPEQQKSEESSKKVIISTISKTDDEDLEELNHQKNYYDTKFNLYGFSDKKSSVYNDLSTNPIQSNTEHSTNNTNTGNQNNEHNIPKETSRDWNAEFQNLIDLEDFPERPALLGNFGQEFVQEVSKTVQTIVDEFFIQDESTRTIPPADIGGIAGGTKFIHNGIVYKMAVDDQDLYKSEESAIKVASHEFRGSIWLSLVQGLRLPLSCMVDYCGVRITAIAKVPISRETLVYGSSNAAETIHNETSPDFGEAQRLMQSAREVLHWKSHSVVERESRKSKDLTGPVDLEIHRGFDGRMYAVDTARVFPPVSPSSFIKKIPVSYLVNLFRPEFLHVSSERLNADAYSRFCQDSRAKKEVDDHTTYMKEAIKVSAEALDTFNEYRYENSEKGQLLNKFFENMDLLTWFHAHGFNFRYLGYFYAHLKAPELKFMVLTEMVTRVAKDDFKKKLRSSVKLDLKGKKEIAAQFFNQGFDPQNESKTYWETDIKNFIQQKFETPLSEYEMSPQFNLQEHINREKVLQDLQLRVGVRTISAYQPFEDEFINNAVFTSTTTFPVSPNDVQMFVITKHRALVCNNYAEKLGQLRELCSQIPELFKLASFVEKFERFMLAITSGQNIHMDDMSRWHDTANLKVRKIRTRFRQVYQ